jgi:hypothetical protein
VAASDAIQHFGAPFQETQMQLRKKALYPAAIALSLLGSAGT